MQCYSPSETGLSPLNILLMIILPMLFNLFVKQLLVLRTNALTYFCAESGAKKEIIKQEISTLL